MGTGDTDSESVDSEETLRLASVSASWYEWGDFYGQILGLTDMQKPRARKLRVGTLCSGTDSPVKAIKHLIGGHNMEHVFTCDFDVMSQKFIQANFEPNHMYHNTSEFAIPTGGYCCICGDHQCQAMMEPLDVLVVGFPCKPHSIQNVNRFEDTDVWSKPAAQPFKHVAMYLRALPQPPRVAILENVAGIQARKSGSTVKDFQLNQQHVDFVMRGQMKKDGKSVKLGLEYLTEYHVLTLKGDAQSCGLPHKRTRVFFVLLHKAFFSKQAVDLFEQKHELVGKRPMPKGNMEKFLQPEPGVEDDSDEDEGPWGVGIIKRRRRSATSVDPSAMALPPAAARDSIAFRNKHNLPLRDAPGGRPFSDMAPRALLQSLHSVREVETIDAMYCLYAKKNDGEYPEKMAIDISQSLNRQRLRIGWTNTPTTKTDIVYGMQKLTLRQLFRIQGWPGRVTFPALSPDRQMRSLIGNMISTPTFGKLFMTMMATLKFDELTTWVPDAA